MAQRRNHMIRTNRRSSHPAIVAGVVAVAVAVVLGGLMLGGSEPGARKPASDPVDVIAPSGPLTASLLGEDSTGNGAGLKLYLDGWTHRILDGRPVTVSLPDGRYAKVQFTPVDAEGIENVLRDAPHVVASTLSRLADGDQRLRCDQTGCGAGDRRIDAAALLTDPSTIGGLGISYQRWGVEHGLYEGRVTVPTDTQMFSVGAEGYAATQLVYVLGDGGDIVSGYGTGSFLLGAAWGRLFPIEARWVQTDENSGDAVRSVRRALADTGDATAFICGNLLAGPADRSPGAVRAASGLNPSQLTYLSSPVTGCGPAVVCTPATVTITTSKSRSEQAVVCEGDGRGILAIRNSTVKIALPHPTHLGGVWPASESNIFAGEENASSVLGYFGRPPLAEGTVTTEMSVIELADGNGIVALAGSRAAGSTEQFGLRQLPEMFGGALTRCG
jgi:hypothetical protein